MNTCTQKSTQEIYIHLTVTRVGKGVGRGGGGGGNAPLRNSLVWLDHGKRGSMPGSPALQADALPLSHQLRWEKITKTHAENSRHCCAGCSTPEQESNCLVCWLVGCLTSKQHASVSQGRIYSDDCTRYHTEIEVADQTFHLTPGRPVPALTL